MVRGWLLARDYAKWCREPSAPPRFSDAADRMAQLADGDARRCLRVVLRAAKMLRQGDHAALHSLGAAALEAVLGDHYDVLWPTVKREAQACPAVATALENVILLPNIAHASEVKRLLAELGRYRVWRDENLPGHNRA
jgi:hypothetical protein